MSNILILGIDGMLGNMLANVFSQKSSGKLFFTSRRNEPVNEYLNGEIINFDALSMGFTNLVSKVQPDFVINCIGAIKPLIKESEPKSVINAQTINSFLPLTIAKSANEFKFRYFSSVSLGESSSDDFRIDARFWNPWEKHNPNFYE